MTTSVVPWQRDAQGNDMVSIPEICGPSWWAMLHGWAKAIETDGCPSCGGFAVKAASALHDLTNIKLGKPVHDEDNFLELAGYYTNAALKIFDGTINEVSMSQPPPPTVTITGKCSGDTEQCEFSIKSTKVTSSVTGSISAIPDAVDEVRRRALEAERNLIPGDGLTFAFGALSGTQYDFRFQLLEVTDLIPSNDPFTFAPSPNYPQELQPRLRDRASLRLQVETLAANLNADLLLTDFHSLDRGAPIIGPDMVVESGNGRAMALIRAAQDQPESYGAYRDALIEQAPDFGFSAADVQGFDSPVLVRLRLTDVNRIEFVQEANLSPAISSSAVETALTDSVFITPGLLSSLFIGDGQNIDEALRATRNTPFTSGFLAALPSQEQAKLVDADGRLNQDGVRRITMAIFSRAFPGESGLRLVENFFESTDANVKNVFNGILMSLGDLVQAETLALTGDRDPELSIGEDLAKGVGVFATIKATPGMTVENFLAQSQLFERSLTPFQETVLKSLDARSRSSRRVGELLRAYAKIVLDQPAPAQGTLIDIERITKEQAWSQAEEASLEPVTGTLFGDPLRDTLPDIFNRDDEDDLFILTERSSGPGLTGIIPKEFASLKVQTRLIRSKAFNIDTAPQITSPEDIQPFVRLMRDADREFLLIIFTDTKARVIGLMEANVGVRAETLVAFDAIMRGAILTGAANVFMAHNHPSGDPEPSPPDRELWNTARERCRLLNIDFPDMLIVGKDRDFSIGSGRSLNAPVPLGQLSQEPPEVRITGKCEGDDVDGDCEFRVKRVETTVKVQGIQAAIDAASDIIEGTRSGNGPAAGGAGPAEVRPLTVELAGGTFDFAPETLIEMSAIANQTNKKERGFALCQDADGMIRPGLRCLGGTCSIRIEDCLGGKDVGIFHTHPNDTPADPESEAIRQKTFSTTDLTPMSRRRDKIMCVSGSRVGVITCAVAKPGAPPLGQVPRATYPYVHPESPDSLRQNIKRVKLTPTGRVSRSQLFNPQVGKNYDFVEFDKVGPGTLQHEPFASLGLDNHQMTQFAMTEFPLALDVSGEGEFVSERIAEPSDFADGSIRTVTEGTHRIRVGCPRGQWDGQQCEVGMTAQSVLHPRSEEQELITEAFNRDIPVLGEPMLQELDELIQSAIKEDELVDSSHALV